MARDVGSFALALVMKGLPFLIFLLILAGRVFGAGFGFALGAITMFTSALMILPATTRSLSRPVSSPVAPGWSIWSSMIWRLMVIPLRFTNILPPVWRSRTSGR